MCGRSEDLCKILEFKFWESLGTLKYMQIENSALRCGGTIEMYLASELAKVTLTSHEYTHQQVLDRFASIWNEILLGRLQLYGLTFSQAQDIVGSYQPVDLPPIAQAKLITQCATDCPKYCSLKEWTSALQRTFCKLYAFSNHSYI
jgi:hypothetical protein